MTTNSKVIIEVRGGIPTAVEQPDGVEVIVHDYDIGAYDYWVNGRLNPAIKKDERGEEYFEKTI